MNSVSVKIFKDKATGLKKGERSYGDVVAIKVQTEKGRAYQPSNIHELVTLQSRVIEENPSFTRVFYMVHEAPKKQPYAVAVRAVQTQDFLTASVAEIPWKTLNDIAKDIAVACPNVSSICYDVTPKPPATIEME
jgi:GMP synthase PP-ATPase subunit